MTIELKFKKTTEETKTVVIETPAFYKCGHDYCKFVEGFCLRVKNSPIIHWKRVEILSQENDGMEYSKILSDGKVITEEEFNEAYCVLHNEMAEIQLQKNPMADLFTT